MPSDVLSRVEEAIDKLAKRLEETYGPVETYLFARFAKGDWLQDSDVDIIVVSERLRGRPTPEKGECGKKACA